MSLPQTLEDLIQNSGKDSGFWTCPMLYGEDGKRKPEHIDPNLVRPSKVIEGVDGILGMLKLRTRSA